MNKLSNSKDYSSKGKKNIYKSFNNLNERIQITPK